jgi:hypothetical protein
MTTTESSKTNLINENTNPSKESNSQSSSNLSSFSNYIDQSTITPYKSFLRENIKSFNLLPNEEKTTKENELENSLKAKYNFDTPTLEIVLKVTSDYDKIQNKLKEYLDIFGEINTVKYDHNANTVKINYKYYFSCLYANRSLTNILENKNEINSAINYYSNCDYSNKSINAGISRDKNYSKNPDKDFTQAFKFLTENYKTNTRFKTQIYKEENIGNSYCWENVEESKNNNISEKKTNFGELKNENKEYIYSPKMKNSTDNSNLNTSNFNTTRTKYKSASNNTNYYYSRKKGNNNFANSMNNMLFPPNLFYQYLSMNNPNTIKIPVPVPVPVPVPMPISTPKLNKNSSYAMDINEKYSSFSKPKIKSSFLNQSKEKDNNTQLQISLNKTKMQTESDNNVNDSPEINYSNRINNFNDNLNENANNNSSQQNSPKIKENFAEKENVSSDADKKEIIYTIDEKDIINEKENISSNISGKSSQDNNQKNDIISSIKLNEKSIDILSTMGQKKLSLDRLNYFLQNNKPVSNFNNPIKNLSSDENEFTSGKAKKFPFPFLFPFPMQFPFKMPKVNKNQFLFPGGFNKNIIDFNKLTLNTRNTIKFDTHSSRDYFYKYVCNYLIQIENDDNFLVTKRIIGKNGCFLKKIIQEACIKFGDFSTKIRLRGKGSGYLEQNGKESDEPLMLCISSLNYPTYYNCCSLIDNLLKKVYNDYYDYLLKILPKELHYSVNKKKVLKHEFVVNRFASGSSSKNRDNNCNSHKAHKEENDPSNECLLNEQKN